MLPAGGRRPVVAFTRLSVIIPVYNDAEVLLALHHRLGPAVAALAAEHEFLFVDDGSQDTSLEVLAGIQHQDPDTVIIKQAGNFGQQQAIAAGLRESTGDAVVIMDSDLQDRPEDIPRLLSALDDQNCSMAIARWVGRNEILPLRQLCRRAFALAARWSGIAYTADLGMFRAIRGQEVATARRRPAAEGGLLDLLRRPSCPYATVDLVRDRRFAGRSGYGCRRLLAFAIGRLAGRGGAKQAADHDDPRRLTERVFRVEGERHSRV